MTKWEGNHFEKKVFRTCAKKDCNNKLSPKDKRIKYCYRHKS